LTSFSTNQQRLHVGILAVGGGAGGGGRERASSSGNSSRSVTPGRGVARISLRV